MEYICGLVIDMKLNISACVVFYDLSEDLGTNRNRNQNELN